MNSIIESSPVAISEDASPLKIDTLIHPNAEVSEQSIRKSEAQLRAIFESSKDGYVLLDCNATILTFNHVAERLYRNVIGLQLEVGKTAYEALPPALRDYMATAFQMVLEGHPLERKSTHIGVDGRQYSILGYYNPVKAADGAITGICIGVSDITAEVETDENLRESESRFRTVADTAPVMIWVAGTDKLCNFFNKGWLDFRGRTMEQEAGNGWAEGVHPEDLGRCLEIYSTSFDARKAFKMEYRLRRHDGQYRWIIDNGVPRYSPDGAFTGYIGSCSDIHEQKQAEEILRESEEHFRTIADNAPVMIWTAKPDRARDFFNKEWLSFTGRTIEQEQGSGWIVDIHPEDVADFVSKYNTAFDTHEGYTTLYRIRRSDGEYRWISASGIPRFSSTGAFLGLIGSCTDVTEQKNTKDELERLVNDRTMELLQKNEELRRQKKFIETTLDASVDQICVYDGDGRFIMANSTFVRMSGKTEDEIIGKKLLEIFPPLEGSKIHSGLTKALAGEFVDNVIWTSPDTGYIYNVFCIPLIENGVVFGAMIVAHDNTTILEASEKVRQSNEELRRTNHELEQFAYVASHDLQEPLRKIMMFSGRLKEDSKAQFGKTENTYLEKITNSSQRMSELISDILNYSRLSNPADSFAKTNLNTTLSTTLADLDLIIEEKKATITSDTLPKIEAIGLQMHQLFHNLIGNGLKFAKKNISPVIAITTSDVTPQEIQERALKPDRAYCKIIFKDNGIGFDQEYAEKIFIVFQRLNSREEYAGTGIGLALCHKIVSFHNGRIFADSKPGEGATFTIILPLKQG